MRYVPLLGVAAAIVISIVRSRLHQRRYGSSTLALFRSSDPGQILRDLALVVLGLAVLGQATAFAIAPDAIAGHFVMAPANGAGVAALAAGLALMIRAQTDLGASWRVGIDENARAGLVTRGVYTFSRNPIFLGMLIGLAGVTLVMPTVLSIVTLVAAFVGIRRQVIEEERYLLRTYGDEYDSYARRVGRFIPWIGRRT